MDDEYLSKIFGTFDTDRSGTIEGREFDELLNLYKRQEAHPEEEWGPLDGPSSLRVFPLFALISRAQESSGAVATMPFVWRSHANSPTTRAGRALDIALRLE